MSAFRSESKCIVIFSGNMMRSPEEPPHMVPSRVQVPGRISSSFRAVSWALRNIGLLNDSSELEPVIVLLPPVDEVDEVELILVPSGVTQSSPCFVMLTLL